MARDAVTLANIAKGGYVLKDAAGAKAVIIATGSEVELAVKAQEALAAEGIAVRVCRCRRPTPSIAKTRPTVKAYCPRAAARRGGSRCHRLLAQVRGPGRRRDRHRQLRRIRSGPGAVQALRHHDRGRRGRGEGRPVKPCVCEGYEASRRKNFALLRALRGKKRFLNLGDCKWQSKLVLTVLAASAAWCSALWRRTFPASRSWRSMTCSTPTTWLTC